MSNFNTDNTMQYPVFVMCGRDLKRRRLLEFLDPEGKYKAKALLPFLGKRVIDWQLDALRASPHIGQIYLLGLSKQDASFDFPVHYVPTDTTADFADKLVAGLEYLQTEGLDPKMIAVSTSDAPAVSTESINLFFERLNKLDGYDFVLSLVPWELTNQVFPDSRRVVARFVDQQVFPGEIYALSPRAIQLGWEVIHELHARRRMINRQRRNIRLTPVINLIAKKPRTWPLILKFLLKRATLADGEKAVSIAFGGKVKAIIIPDAGFGMDMDLPEDYARLEKYIAGSV
ncbi:MAG: NTP transferase domain-containing protein [Anaerolineales bacterium]|jgi:NDP-sugar pyrophosphorylase family protein